MSDSGSIQLDSRRESRLSVRIHGIRDERPKRERDSAQGGRRKRHDLVDLGLSVLKEIVPRADDHFRERGERLEIR